MARAGISARCTSSATTCFPSSSAERSLKEVPALTNGVRKPATIATRRPGREAMGTSWECGVVTALVRCVKNHRPRRRRGRGRYQSEAASGLLFTQLQQVVPRIDPGGMPIAPLPCRRATLRHADPSSRLGAGLRPDVARAARRSAPRPRRGLRPRQLDPATPTGRGRRRSRAGDAAPGAPPRTGGAAGLPRRRGVADPLFFARRGDPAQRTLPPARSGLGVARGRARAPAGGPRRAPRAAGRTSRHALRAGPRPALAAMGGDRRALAGDEQGLWALLGGVALDGAGIGRTAHAAHRGDAGGARAARDRGEAVTILPFSDPHVQLPRWRERPLRDFGPLRALATVELWKGRGRDYDGALATLRQIVRDADTLRADLVVCTGDLTQLAMEEEFALARDALAPLGERLVCIPGNHDRYPLALEANRLFEKYFPPRPLPDGFAALDSCGELCWPVITHGRIVV